MTSTENKTKERKKLRVTHQGVYKDVTDEIVGVLSSIGECKKISFRKIYVKTTTGNANVEVIVCEDGIDFMVTNKKETLDSSKGMCYPSNDKLVVTTSYFLYYRDILDYENDILNALYITLGHNVRVEPAYLYYRQNDNENGPIIRTKILRYSKSGKTVYTEDGNSWKINTTYKTPYITLKGGTKNIHGYIEIVGCGYGEIYKAFMKTTSA